MAIYEHSNATETRWGKGDFKAMIKSPRAERPVGYCDGTPEDERELIQTAEREGLSGVYIQRKTLKTGREIWTVLGDGGFTDEEW